MIQGEKMKSSNLKRIVKLIMDQKNISLKLNLNFFINIFIFHVVWIKVFIEL